MSSGSRTVCPCPCPYPAPELSPATSSNTDRSQSAHAAFDLPQLAYLRRHRFRRWSAFQDTSGVDLTFAPHLAESSSSECQIQNSTGNPLFAGGPLILTVAKVP